MTQQVGPTSSVSQRVSQGVSKSRDLWHRDPKYFSLSWVFHESFMTMRDLGFCIFYKEWCISLPPGSSKSSCNSNGIRKFGTMLAGFGIPLYYTILKVLGKQLATIPTTVRHCWPPANLPRQHDGPNPPTLWWPLLNAGSTQREQVKHKTKLRSILSIGSSLADTLSFVKVVSLSNSGSSTAYPFWRTAWQTLQVYTGLLRACTNQIWTKHQKPVGYTSYIKLPYLPCSVWLYMSTFKIFQALPQGHGDNEFNATQLDTRR